MARMSFDLSVYCVVDPQACAGRNPSDVAVHAALGGATMIQYRDKRGDVDAAYAGAKAMQKALRDHGLQVPFLVNDYPEIAADIGADGVHVGQGDMRVQDVRDMIGADKILGLTAFTADHMTALDPALVDYVGTGPVFPTLTDKGKPVLGIEGMRPLVALSPVPVVAIGGITADKAADVMTSGCAGVAMMRAVTAADDSKGAAQDFKTVLDNINKGQIR